MCMVPNQISESILNSLPDKDKDILRQLSFFNVDKLGMMAINDFCLEISHFFDDALISRVI